MDFHHTPARNGMVRRAGFTERGILHSQSRLVFPVNLLSPLSLASSCRCQLNYNLEEGVRRSPAILQFARIFWPNEPKVEYLLYNELVMRK
jgi:hypothetical protein